jgi:peptidoglycan/xylan/chitin deacetylase (PgdA/CDA1 family)
MKRYKRTIALLLLAAVCAYLYMPSVKAAAAEARVPVIMYHSLHASASDKWVLPPEQFEEDLRFLSENGYTSITASELVAFVRGDGTLPDKPIILSFDDGYYNNLSQGLPLLEKYAMKIVLSVIGEHADIWTADGGTDERDGHATWPQLAELARSGWVELANHTQSLHTTKNGRHGCVRMAGEDKDSYHQMFAADLQALQDRFTEHCGVSPVCFAYPFGVRCEDALGVLKDMGFLVTLSC